MVEAVVVELTASPKEKPCSGEKMWGGQQRREGRCWAVRTGELLCPCDLCAWRGAVREQGGQWKPSWIKEIGYLRHFSFKADISFNVSSPLKGAWVSPRPRSAGDSNTLWMCCYDLQSFQDFGCLPLDRVLGWKHIILWVVLFLSVTFKLKEQWLIQMTGDIYFVSWKFSMSTLLLLA